MQKDWLQQRNKSNKRFEYYDVRLLTEYVGCKVERNEDSFKFTPPVLLQRFVNEFGCKREHKTYLQNQVK